MPMLKFRFESLLRYQASCHVDSLEHVSNSVYFWQNMCPGRCREMNSNNRFWTTRLFRELCGRHTGFLTVLIP